ncbi:hypothetical protein [Erythrobacter sp. MTPC3]|uniref:hypothetical protein n=1 Tax=Erythrobacter sp. MTPC3 TaxID=3056564 RepID=UPI0036F20F07
MFRAAPIPPDEARREQGRLQRVLQKFRSENSRTRAVSMGIALLLEAVIIGLLFLIGLSTREETDMAESVAVFQASDFTDNSPEPQSAPEESAEPVSQPVIQPAEQEPAPRPEVPSEPALPAPRPLTNIPVPAPSIAPPAEPQPPADPPPMQGPPRNYGPVDTGPQGGYESQRVGTASNGQPLYAAQWYREPTDQELAGYLSTASGPGSALIACRTVPNYYVEDCELVGESPQGSQIGRAVLAAAWQFRVRPARIGGRSQVGSWVRIRIDYIRRPARR